MILDRRQVGGLFESAAENLLAHTDELTEIDSHFGDGDHGYTISKIARLIQSKVPELEETGLQEWFDDLGAAIMGISGGSAGPLYGTLIGGFGVPLEADTEAVDAPLLKKMFAGALSEMQDITSAKAGDKTMMDALIPAVAAAEQAPDDIPAVLEAAAQAAAAGAEKSRDYVSKYGRARSYKEKTIGTPDAGALSTSYLIEGLASGVEK
ncbi:MAG: dihydroxyacetone kinase subunit L [Bacilli bacterium]|jgi:dihydroxyacetone kinase-like protein